MQASFQPKRLQQARFLKRMTLAELGVRGDITRQSLSQFERGERSPAPDTLAKLADVLAMPVEFFLRPFGRLESGRRSLVHYRSLTRTRDIILERQRATALLELSAAVIDSIEDHIDYQGATVPSLLSSGDDVLSMDGEAIEQIAMETRKKMGLGDGPISDLTLLIENQSVPIVYTPLPPGMEGLSAWFEDRPVIVASSEASYARSRTNVAHEFGHLVLHRGIGDGDEIDKETFNIVESQAWRFAGAFEMPAASFLSEIYSVSLDALRTLKEKWGVSVAMMIKRLSVLGVIGEDQTRYLNIQLRQRGWHKKEPGDDRPREKSRLANRAVRFLSQHASLPIHEFSRQTKLPTDFLANAFEVDRSELLPPVPKNIIEFKLRTASQH